MTRKISADYFRREREPRVLITTNYKPSGIMYAFIADLLDVLPDATYYKRQVWICPPLGSDALQALRASACTLCTSLLGASKTSRISCKASLALLLVSRQALIHRQQIEDSEWYAKEKASEDEPLI